MEENMKRFFVLLALLAAVLLPASVFAGGGGQQSGGGGSAAQGSSGGGITVLVENTDINDTTSDIDISRLTLKSAPGLSGKKLSTNNLIIFSEK
jgi:hypothetical protein